MRRSSLVAQVAVLSLSIVSACSSADRSGFDNSTDPNNAPPGAGGGPGGGSGFGPGGGGDGGKPTGVCSPNAANFDIPGNNCDDDGDGKVDNPPVCDTGITGNAAVDFAHAMGVCDDAAKRGFGLVAASFEQGGDPQHGVLPKFGSVIKPREGSALAVLSTGYGQEYDGASNASFGGATGNGISSFKLNGKDWSKPGTAPAGFPKSTAGCGGGAGPVPVNDVVNLKLQIKAPPNVSGIKFDFNFYSGEWPAYVCSSFNDGFIAYLSAAGFNSGKPDNMSFDSKNNPVSVNNGFFDRCTPSVAIGCANPAGSSGKSACPGGPSELAGTGFGVSGQWCKPFGLPGIGGSSDTSTNGGATGWLTSQAPVNPGETFTIEFYIWDAGDGMLDSSVLLDNFTWVAGAVTTSTERPN